MGSPVTERLKLWSASEPKEGPRDASGPWAPAPRAPDPGALGQGLRICISNGSQAVQTLRVSGPHLPNHCTENHQSSLVSSGAPQEHVTTRAAGIRLCGQGR